MAEELIELGDAPYKLIEDSILKIQIAHQDVLASYNIVCLSPKRIYYIVAVLSKATISKISDNQSYNYERYYAILNCCDLKSMSSTER